MVQGDSKYNKKVLTSMMAHLPLTMSWLALDYIVALHPVLLTMKFLYVFIPQTHQMFTIVIGLELMEIRRMYSNMLLAALLVLLKNIILTASFGKITQAFNFYLMDKMF